MMDGGSSGATNGLQLLCYWDEVPVSDARFPVIDLTKLGGNINWGTIAKKYAGWVWSHLDDVRTLSKFEAFLVNVFDSVLDRMPFEVVEDCFSLWDFFVVKKTALLRAC